MVDARLVGIPSGEVAGRWPELEPFIVSALQNSGGRYRAEHVLSAVLKAEMQVWITVDDGIKAVVVTELRTYPTGLKALNVFAIAGQGLSESGLIEEVLEAYARCHGCDVMEGCGRAGWGRAMGWVERFRVVERRL